MTTLLKILIVDDEPPARRVLEHLVDDHPSALLVGTASDGLEALSWLATAEVDVILADIDMPRLSGLALVARLEPHRAPAVVFVTAHSEHAVQAFELGAADYLLKPVAPDRFALALERARIQRGAAGDHGRLARLLLALRRGPIALDAPEHLWAHVRGGRERLPIIDIDVIRADGDYVRLITGAGEFLADGPLDDLASRLAATGFLRVHRSTLVRLDAVAKITTEGRQLVLTMRCGARVTVGRRKASHVRDRLLG